MGTSSTRIWHNKEKIAFLLLKYRFLRWLSTSSQFYSLRSHSLALFPMVSSQEMPSRNGMTILRSRLGTPLSGFSVQSGHPCMLLWELPPTWYIGMGEDFQEMQKQPLLCMEHNWP